MKIYRVFFALLIVFTSCKSSKTALGSAFVTKKMSAKKVAKKHDAILLKEQRIEAKLKVHYKDAKTQQSVSVTLRIKKDSIIWLNATYAGFVVARAKITPTRVSYYEKLKKTYFDGDFTLLQSVLGTEVNFSQLQHLLLGEAIFDLTATKHNVAIEDNAHLLSPKTQNDLFDVLFWINPLHYKLDKQTLEVTDKNQSLEIRYPAYLTVEKEVFPKQISIEGKADSKTTNISVDVKKVVFNKQFSTSYRIPRGYKKVNFNE